jgi:hypothetical protein
VRAMLRVVSTELLECHDDNCVLMRMSRATVCGLCCSCCG